MLGVWAGPFGVLDFEWSVAADLWFSSFIEMTNESLQRNQNNDRHSSVIFAEAMAANASPATPQAHRTVSFSARPPATSVPLTTFFKKYCRPLATCGVSLTRMKVSINTVSSLFVSAARCPCRMTATSNSSTNICVLGCR